MITYGDMEDTTVTFMEGKMEGKMFKLVFDDFRGKETIIFHHSAGSGRIVASGDRITVYFSGIEHVPGALRLTEDGSLVGYIQYSNATTVEMME